jgi:hypothetical protein
MLLKPLQYADVSETESAASFKGKPYLWASGRSLRAQTPRRNEQGNWHHYQQHNVADTEGADHLWSVHS